MMKLFKHFSLLAVAAIISAIALSSCSSDGEQTRYVAAKLVDSDMWSIVDLNTGEILYKDEFKSQPSVIVDDKFCVKNESGLYDYFSVSDVKKPINKESFLLATAFNESGVALIVKKGEGISIINEKCEVVKKLDNSIVSAGKFSNGLCYIKDDKNKIGFIDEKGNVVIKPKYDSAQAFSKDGVAIVGKEVNDSVTNFSAIDKSGKELFKFSSTEYVDHSSFYNGHIAVKKRNNEVILLDKEGKKGTSIGKWNGFIPYTLVLNNNLIVFKDGDSYGLKDEKGDIVLRAKYDELYPLTDINDNYFLAQKQDKYGVIDKDDNEIIAFDYSILAFINKNTLVQGDSKMFSFMNLDGKDVGQNNYINLSFWLGADIKSNYFNADREASKIMENMTATSFFKTKKGNVLRDFKDKLSGYKYADLDETTVTDYGYPYTFLYGFDRNLSSQTYEYFYGYRFPKGAEYNYNANLTIAITHFDVSDYQPGSEEALVKVLGNKLHNIGFEPSKDKENYYVNASEGTAVGLGYDKGLVTIAFVYNLNYMIPIDRNQRDKDAEIKIDSVDTFGLETVTLESDDVDADTVAVVSEY